MSAKCQACHKEHANWAWQPFGPDETPDTFTVLGAHYRGFAAIKVCNACRWRIKSGESVTFTYRKRSVRFQSGEFTAA